MDDWTFEETIGAPATIKIEFMDPSGAAQTAELISTTWSKTYTTYITWEYTDRDDKPQTQDVAVRVVTDTRSTVAAVNGSLVKWKLQRGEGLPAGDAMRQGVTVNEWITTKDGPRMIRSTTEEFISEYELAGSLNINDYTGFTPGTAMVQASRTINEYNEISGPNIRTATKTSTSRYQALGLNQEGQQALSKQLQEDPGTGVVTNKVFNAAKALVFDGTEVQTSIGRAPMPVRPSGYELLANELLNPTDPEAEDGSTDSGSTTTDETDSSGSVTVRFDFTGLGLGSEIDYAYYSLPFTPDLYQGRTGRYAAELAAREYARCLNGLKAAYAFGFNITTSADRLPSLPLSPLFINAAGLSVAMRVNGVSWAFDASGLVASADMMLCGVAGRIGPVSSSWVRLPVPTASLPVLSEPTATENPAPASTITAPSGFDATSPGNVFTLLPTTNTGAPALTQTTTAVVEPYLLIEPLVARSRHRMRIAEFEYPLLSTEAIDLISHHRATAGVAIAVVVPAVEVAAAAPAPSVSTGATIAVPAVAVAAAAGVPEVTAVGPPGTILVPPVVVLAQALAPIIELAAPWTPASLTGLALWLDAADASTVLNASNTPATSGQKVATWSDKSGNSRNLTQSDDSQRPFIGPGFLAGTTGLLNGKQVVTFDWIDESDVSLKTIGSPSFAMGQTFVMVGYRLSSGMPFAEHGSSTYRSLVGSLSFTTATHSTYALDGGAPAASLLDGASGINDPRVYVGQSRQSSTSRQLFLGQGDYGSSYRLQGYVAELVISSATLSAADRQKVEGYLAHKWGLAANLPADHPWKASAPTA